MNSATSAVRSRPVQSKPDKSITLGSSDFSTMTPDAFNEPGECPQCDTALRVNNGLCLLCLLQTGLTEDEDSGSESLEPLLSEFD